jgi:cell division protein FtsB
MKQKIVNIMGLVLPILTFLILASSLVKGVTRIRQGNEIIKKTEMKLAKISEENRKLEEQVQIVSSPEYKEKQLRDKMGLVKEGEVVLVLPEPEIVKKLVPNISFDEVVPLKPNYLKWVELFK